MTVTVYRTITEGTNGRRENPDSPTGWERRTAETREQVTDRGGGRTKTLRVPVWEPCDPPQTVVYGSPEHEAAGFKGGTLRTIVEGVEAKPYDLTAEEAETILRVHAHDWNTGMNIYHGGQVIGNPVLEKMRPHEGHEMAEAARARVLALFGVDLATTNIMSIAPLR